nr:SDR family oxidoreductase [Roseomonas sp. HF4]
MSSSFLITGASSGIGRAVADRLLRKGYRLHLASRRAPLVTEGAAWVPMDVDQDASVAAAMAAIGPVDGVVCCAGFAVFGSVEEVPIERAKAQFETNLFGSLRVVRAALPVFRRAGRGRIVLVGSLAGRAPIPFQAHYSASKAAIEAIAQSLYNEVAPFGVHVSLVEPGDIRTAFNDNTDWAALANSDYGHLASTAAATIRRTLLAAPGPELVAAAIEHALTAHRPRFRYSMGPGSRVVGLARRLLPDAVCLRLLRRHFLRPRATR